MEWCQVALITALVVLLQSDAYQARSCNNRKTVIQIRIPGKTNVTIKYPSKVEPVKFVPSPGTDKIAPNCYICHGRHCRKCNPLDNQLMGSSLGRIPLITNIIIDLKRNKAKPKQTETENNDNTEPNTNGNENPPQSGSPPSPGSGNNNPSPSGSKEDGTIVVVQDLTSAFGKSGSAASVINDNGKEAAASSATSAATANAELIGSFDQNSSSDGPNTEDIFVENDSQSDSQATALSGITSKSLDTILPPTSTLEAIPIPPPPPPKSEPTQAPAPTPETNPQNVQDDASAASALEAEANENNNDESAAAAGSASTAKASAQLATEGAPDSTPIAPPPPPTPAPALKSVPENVKAEANNNDNEELEAIAESTSAAKTIAEQETEVEPDIPSNEDLAASSAVAISEVKALGEQNGKEADEAVAETADNAEASVDKLESPGDDVDTAEAESESSATAVADSE